MFNPLRISYVVEGPTDYLVLDALVEQFLNTDNYVSTQIQPPISAFADNQGPLGGGWKGVLRWCEEIGAVQDGLANSMVVINCDCLIIHVDADIASEDELRKHDLSVPCPPAKETCDRIRHRLISLLGGPLPPKVVLCIPAQCTEAWVFAVLHPDLLPTYQPIECRPKVERLLIGKPDGLVRDKDGQAKKQTARYRSTVARIAANWSRATSACAEAFRFEADCKTALTSATSLLGADQDGLPKDTDGASDSEDNGSSQC